MCCCLDCRFRTVLLYTQRGQPSHSWLTWPSCSSMTQTCPKHSVPPSHSPFWLECCLCGECKAKGRNIAFKMVVFIPFFFFICWISRRFILENSVLDKHVRFIVSVYPVVIWALAGICAKNYKAGDPSRNNIFVGEELKQMYKSVWKQEIVCN